MSEISGGMFAILILPPSFLPLPLLLFSTHLFLDDIPVVLVSSPLLQACAHCVRILYPPFTVVRRSGSSLCQTPAVAKSHDSIRVSGKLKSSDFSDRRCILWCFVYPTSWSVIRHCSTHFTLMLHHLVPQLMHVHLSSLCALWPLTTTTQSRMDRTSDLPICSTAP